MHEEFIPRFLPGTYVHIDARHSVELDFARYGLHIQNGQLVAGTSDQLGKYYEIERLTGGYTVRRLYLEVILVNKAKLFDFDSNGEMVNLTKNPFGVIWEYGPELYTDAELFLEARRRKNKSEGFNET